MKKLCLFMFALFVSGCVTPSQRMAIMHNPETGATQKCEVDPWREWSWEYQALIDQCVKGYEKAGFIRVDEHPEKRSGEAEAK